MIKNSPHLIQMGRRSTCTIPDLINKGIGLLHKGKWDGSEDSSGERPTKRWCLRTLELSSTSDSMIFTMSTPICIQSEMYIKILTVWFSFVAADRIVVVVLWRGWCVGQIQLCFRCILLVVKDVLEIKCKIPIHNTYTLTYIISNTTDLGWVAPVWLRKFENVLFQLLLEQSRIKVWLSSNILLSY